MQKRVRAVLTISLSVGVFAVLFHYATAQVDYAELKRGVVKVIAHKPDNVTDTGAGIIVGVEEQIAFIVTAHHVIKDANKIDIVFFDKQYVEFPARPFRRYHEDLDIGMVLVESAEGRTLPPNLPRYALGEVARLKEGEKVSTIGHPLNTEWQTSIKVNTIAGLSAQEDSRKFRLTKVALDRGNSGGPIFDENGGLIGMITSLAPVHAIALKIDAVLSVLKDEWRIPTWWRSEERKIALARELAAWSVGTRSKVAEVDAEEKEFNWRGLIERKGRVSLLQRSVLLAVESMQRSSSPAAEQALRDGLGWLTRPIALIKASGDPDAIAFSPDGKHLVTVNDTTARIWEVTSRRELAHMTHEKQVGELAFSRDGTYLATLPWRGTTAHVWEATSGREVSRVTRDREIDKFAFSPNGKYLATGENSASDTALVVVWDTASGREVSRMTHRDYVNALVFSPDERYLATASGSTATPGSGSNIARVWEAATGREVARMVHAGDKSIPYVNRVAFSPDGTYLATASADGTARVWEVTSSREVARINHRAEVHALVFSPDGRYVASGDQGAIARIWEPTSSQEVARVHHLGWWIWDLAFSPNSKYLATADRNGTTYVWEAASGREVARMIYTGRLAFSPDGQYLVTGDKAWLLWPHDLVAEACVRLSRNLTPEEWRQYLGDEPYRTTCPNLP